MGLRKSFDFPNESQQGEDNPTAPSYPCLADFFAEQNQNDLAQVDLDEVDVGTSEPKLTSPQEELGEVLARPSKSFLANVRESEKVGFVSDLE